MEINKNEYDIPVKVNITLLKIAGFWKPETKCIQIISKFYMIVFLVIYTPAFTLPLIYDLFVKTDDLIHWINILFHLIAEFEVLLKTVRFLRDNERIKKLTNSTITIKHFCPKYRRQKQFIDDSIQTSNQLTIIVVSFCILAGFIYGLVPFIDTNSSILPVDVEYPFDTEKTPNFQITYCYQMPMVYFVAINAGLLMTFVTSLMSFVCAQIKILKQSFQYMTEYAAIDLMYKERKEYLLNNTKDINLDNFDTDLLWEQVYVNFQHSIQHHNEILKFLNEIQDVFGMNFLIDIVSSSSVIGCTCVALTNGAEFTFRSVTIVMVCAVGLIQLAVCCYFGNNIIEEGRTITHSLYFSNWLDAPLNIKRMIIFTMENCKKTTQIFAGLSVNLSLHTLLNILKKTYSLIAVLQDAAQ